jgi:hypothetical protein
MFYKLMLLLTPLLLMKEQPDKGADFIFESSVER